MHYFYLNMLFQFDLPICPKVTLVTQEIPDLEMDRLDVSIQILFGKRTVLAEVAFERLDFQVNGLDVASQVFLLRGHVVTMSAFGTNSGTFGGGHHGIT